MKNWSKMRPEMVVGAVVLGTLALSFVIVDRDWHRARAHELAMTGRGTYR